MVKEKLKIKINSEHLANVINKKIGDVIEIESKKGVPIERFWRKRLLDSNQDKCIEICKEKTTKKTTKASEDS